MNSPKDDRNADNTEMISASDAAYILGFKQTSPIMNYAKQGFLTAHESPRNNRKYFRLEEILGFPKPLPVPPPAKRFKGHGRSVQDQQGSSPTST